ncbi:hypothetical protein [Nostoc sp. JL31]|nr:hypothetical protein [Nostoc sp. JL31]
MDDIVCCDACGGKLRSIISYDQNLRWRQPAVRQAKRGFETPISL